ncbi:hypothetical protein GTP55_13120 [Duganella sp. FT109W]|uniref:Uncharacterized protein n=1 Tax=Duganella margarita TaxID=2692170 RepID=A0ABW9WGR2_9BURK|nr:hypothetical protein [Duganella margarita]MYN40317.1 hypothetical protein [Duganella margarita]
MTVLAYLEDLGLAFADVMLSVDAPGGHLVLPTVGDTRNVAQALPVSPSRLVRKFFRLKGLGQSGMFLVAGTVSHIERLIDNIGVLRSNRVRLSAAQARTFNPKDPASIVHTACLLTEQQGWPEFEILGVIAGQTFVRNYDANRLRSTLPYYGNVYVAGSGGQDLYKWLEERAVFYAAGALAEESLADKGLRAMNSIPMVLLREDALTRVKTISKGVGGYYETYYLSDNALHPVGDVLTVTASIAGKGTTPPLLIERMYYHTYVNDWLLVASLFDTPLTVTPGAAIEIPLSQFELFKIPPIFEPGPEPNWTIHRLLKSAEVAEMFRLTLRQAGESGVSKRFSEGARPSRRLLTCRISGDKLQLSLDQEGHTHYAARIRNSAHDELTLQLRH